MLSYSNVIRLFLFFIFPAALPRFLHIRSKRIFHRRHQLMQSKIWIRMCSFWSIPKFIRQSINDVNAWIVLSVLVFHYRRDDGLHCTTMIVTKTKWDQTIGKSTISAADEKLTKRVQSYILCKHIVSNLSGMAHNLLYWPTVSQPDVLWEMGMLVK